MKSRLAGRCSKDLKCSMSEAIAFLSFSAAWPDAKPLQCWSNALRFFSREGLAEFTDDVGCAEVGVALECLDRLVATDSPYLYRAQSLLKQSCHRFVSKVVEP